jgi:hypothetical protein
VRGRLDGGRRVRDEDSGLTARYVFEDVADNGGKGGGFPAKGSAVWLELAGQCGGGRRLELPPELEGAYSLLA